MSNIYINCKFRNEIIVPIRGISPNIEFLALSDKKKVGKVVTMKDDIIAKVVGCETKTIFDFEKEIKELYKVEPYEWLRKWHQASDGTITSIVVCHIYLKKHEIKEEEEWTTDGNQ